MSRTPRVIKTYDMCKPMFAHNACNNIMAPCKDCTERYVGCHNECVKYKEYKAKIKKEKEAKMQIVSKYMDYRFSRKTMLNDRIRWS